MVISGPSLTLKKVHLVLVLNSLPQNKLMVGYLFIITNLL